MATLNRDTSAAGIRPTPAWLAQAQTIWENQPPLVRGNVSMGLGFAALIAVLHGGIYAAVRLLDAPTVFGLETWLRLLNTLLFLMLLIGVYNALRLLWQYVNGDGVTTWRGVTLASISVMLIAQCLVIFPSVFKASVSYSAGRSYGVVYADFRTLCERWEPEWLGAEAVTLDPATQELGQLGDEAEVFRVRNSIIFNFGEPEKEFGLACALGNRSPSDSGRAVNY